jgi:hypothetical protein
VQARRIHRLMSRALANLDGGQRARYVLRLIEKRRAQHGHVTEADAVLVAQHMPAGPDRAVYIRMVREWCQAHDIETDLHREDELDDVGKSLLVRFHIVERRMAWERPKIEAMESYVTSDGFMAWRQHPWEPSGILPVPPNAEEAWLDFIEWVKGSPMRYAEVPLRRETYLKIFTEDKPYHAWELRQPDKPAS